MDKENLCCADCDWFALQPMKRRSGVCFKKWLPNVDVDGTFGAYGRVFPFDDVCEYYTEIGTLDRYEPSRPGNL